VGGQRHPKTTERPKNGTDGASGEKRKTGEGPGKEVSHCGHALTNRLSRSQDHERRGGTRGGGAMAVAKKKKLKKKGYSRGSSGGVLKQAKNPPETGGHVEGEKEDGDIGHDGK